jgi:hypothetical protein
LRERLGRAGDQPARERDWVKIILGGSFHLIADNPNGVVELYARDAAASTRASEARRV